MSSRTFLPNYIQKNELMYYKFKELIFSKGKFNWAKYRFLANFQTNTIKFV